MKEIEILMNLARALRNMADNMQRVNPQYARTLLERAEAHERKAMELPAWGRA